jgi:hypothetical protein
VAPVRQGCVGFTAEHAGAFLLFTLDETRRAEVGAVVASPLTTCITAITSIIIALQVVPCGVAGVSDVRARGEGGGRVLEDLMPSYFTAETLKYLYLLFTPEHALLQDGWVFNTEAHPVQLPVFLGNSGSNIESVDTAAAAASIAPSIEAPWFSAGVPADGSCVLPPFWLKGCMHGLYFWPQNIQTSGSREASEVEFSLLDDLHAAAASADDEGHDGDWGDVVLWLNNSDSRNISSSSSELWGLRDETLETFLADAWSGPAALRVCDLESRSSIMP